MEDFLLQVEEVLLEKKWIFCSSFYASPVYLVEVYFVVSDSHPMLFFRVAPHPLERQNFPTEFASSLANICEAVAEPELDL